MAPRSKPSPLSAADARPIKVTRPRLATDPDALGLDLADLIAAAHTTTDGRVVAVGLDLAPLSGFCYALIEPGKPFDPKADFTVLGQLDLKGGEWDNYGTIFVRLGVFLHVLRPAAVFFRELPDPRTSAGAVAVTAGRKYDDEVRAALKEALTDWAARCSVPCVHFAVGALKRRFTGRGVATKADLVIACNQRFGVHLDADGVEVTGVDRVATAALGLLAGLEDRLVAAGPKSST